MAQDLKHLCAGGKHDTGPVEVCSGIAAWGEAGYNSSSLCVGSWIELLLSQQCLQSSNFWDSFTSQNLFMQ